MSLYLHSAGVIPQLSLIFMAITFLKNTSQLSCRSFLIPCLMFHHYIQVIVFSRNITEVILCSLLIASYQVGHDFLFVSLLVRGTLIIWSDGDNQASPLFQFSSVQLLSCVGVFATPWTAACQASLPITNSWSLSKLMSIELVTPSNHLILCCPLLLLPSIFPSIRIFSNDSVLHIRWPKYWSFSFNISPSNKYSGLISFRRLVDLLAVQGILESSPTPQFKSFSFLYSPTLTTIHDYWKNHSFD